MCSSLEWCSWNWSKPTQACNLFKVSHSSSGWRLQRAVMRQRLSWSAGTHRGASGELPMLDQVGFQDFLKTAEIGCRSHSSFWASGVYGTTGHWRNLPGGAGHVWCGCRFVSSCRLLMAGMRNTVIMVCTVWHQIFFWYSTTNMRREGGHHKVETIKRSGDPELAEDTTTLRRPLLFQL